MNTANWDLQDHDQHAGPFYQLGAAFSVPAGQGVVVGNEIPYQPWALEKKKENQRQWLTLDPEVKCYLPGLPRATYMPYPFQIVQTPKNLVFAYGYANASRIVYMNTKVEAQIDTWMGYSSGRWEGETLVIENEGFNDQSWFDRAGNFHSEALKVTERYTATGPDALAYEATIEDPKVFTRPWQIRMPLYRRLEPRRAGVDIQLHRICRRGHLRAPSQNARRIQVDSSIANMGVRSMTKRDGGTAAVGRWRMAPISHAGDAGHIVGLAGHPWPDGDPEAQDHAVDSAKNRRWATGPSRGLELRPGNAPPAAERIRGQGPCDCRGSRQV